MLCLFLYISYFIGDVLDLGVIFDLHVLSKLVLYSAGVDEIDCFVCFGHLMKVVSVFYLSV